MREKDGGWGKWGGLILGGFFERGRFKVLFLRIRYRRGEREEGSCFKFGVK